ncbi:MAG TPA: ABC transporter permease subunit [Candidatus Nanoarchaeia archaeon]|nr:ABC transporter permease subunit [Candidatus Nanoarchaeia archaeon]
MAHYLAYSLLGVAYGLLWTAYWLFGIAGVAIVVYTIATALVLIFSIQEFQRQMRNALGSIIHRPFSIMRRPGPRAALFLSLLPFATLLFSYMYFSEQRHRENPEDKFMPTIGKIGTAFLKVTVLPENEKTTLYDHYPWLQDFENRPGVQRWTSLDRGILLSAFRMALTIPKNKLWKDTIASGTRFLEALLLLSFAVLLGLYMGVFPYWESVWLKFMTYSADKIAPLALYPILILVFGVGELNKVALMVIGTFPTICLDTYKRASSVPREQKIKAMTLAASNMEIAHLIVFPQIFPDVMNTIRLSFKPLILFLIAAESLGANAGLGFQIFYVRRFIQMDLIIAYVVWLALLTFLVDQAVLAWIRRRRWTLTT